MYSTPLDPERVAAARAQGPCGAADSDEMLRKRELEIEREAFMRANEPGEALAKLFV